MHSIAQCLESLVHILNFCLTESVFPSLWKCSVVIPLFKIPSSSFSYRPISLPPLLSKLLEFICSQQLNAFLSNANIIPTFQSSFRIENDRTTTALLHTSDTILHNIDKGSLSALIIYS